MKESNPSMAGTSEVWCFIMDEYGSSVHGATTYSAPLAFESTPQYRIITILMVSMDFGPVNRTPSPSTNCTTTDNCEVTVYADHCQRAFAQQNTRQQDFTSSTPAAGATGGTGSAHGTATPRASITAMGVGALAKVIHNKDGSARAYLTRKVLW